jgi:aspartate/methionine/tyrosine aminotransferase
MAELEAVARVCIEQDLVAVSDEVYEHCVFPGSSHRQLAGVPGMRERTITLGSGGKLFSLTGWRVAWAVSNQSRPLSSLQLHSAWAGGRCDPACGSDPFEELKAPPCTVKPPP